MADDTYLVRAEEISAMEGLTKTHFINPGAVRTNKSLGDLTGLTGLGFHIVEVEPGFESTEYHVHYFEDEAVYILEGTATVELGDESFEVKPGDFIGYRKAGLPHTMTNTGDTTLRCIVVGQRLPHDVGDYPRKGKRLYRNENMDWDMTDHTNLEHPQGGAKK